MMPPWYILLLFAVLLAAFVGWLGWMAVHYRVPASEAADFAERGRAIMAEREQLPKVTR